jgi:hypothetical protein
MQTVVTTADDDALAPLKNSACEIRSAQQLLGKLQFHLSDLASIGRR